MGHKNKISLNQQVCDVLQSKLRIGQSKYEHKRAGDYRDFIFSWSTYRAYQKHSLYFAKWAKETHRCKNVDQLRQYADEWIQSRIDAGLSAYTLKLEVAALSKLFGDTAADYIRTPARLRANITRSRGQAKRDANFSEETFHELVEFAKSTGLRRHELSALRAGDLKEENGNYYVHVRKGKGGKERYALVVGNIQNVLDCFARAERNANGKLFNYIPAIADIHSFRSEYARTVYNMTITTPDPKTIKDRKDIYCCRKELRHVWYQRSALLYTSQCLGHNRVCVVAEHYLRA